MDLAKAIFLPTVRIKVHISRTGYGSMPKTHRALGLSITYPDNWQVTEQTDNEEAGGYELQGPTGAFLSVYPCPWPTSPEGAVIQATEAIASDYDNVESEVFFPELTSSSGLLTGVQGRELYFYYLDLLVRAKLIAFEIPDQTILVHIQAEDSDFRSLEKVFDAMLLTLCQSIDRM